MMKRGVLMVKQRKAQVTIFILLALLLLVAAGVTLTIKWNANKEKLDTEFKKSISDASSSFYPVDFFISTCLEKTTKEGIRVIGLHGGVLYPPSSFIVRSDDPVNSDGVQISTTTLPYWVHAKTPTGMQPQVTLSGIPPLCKAGRTSCVTTVNAPSPFDGSSLAGVSIEEQLERYIKEELPRCLNDFSDLREKGFTFDVLGMPEPSVSMRQKDYNLARDGDVFVGLYYPLKVTYQNTE